MCWLIAVFALANVQSLTMTTSLRLTLLISERLMRYGDSF